MRTMITAMMAFLAGTAYGKLYGHWCWEPEPSHIVVALAVAIGGGLMMEWVERKDRRERERRAYMRGRRLPLHRRSTSNKGRQRR
jgi:divalent metal cation (Fe/Co/Zn/Cd) transporter